MPGVPFCGPTCWRRLRLLVAEPVKDELMAGTELLAFDALSQLRWTNLCPCSSQLLPPTSSETWPVGPWHILGLHLSEP